MPWNNFLKTCARWWHATSIFMPNKQPPTLHTSLIILAISFIRKAMPLVWKDHHGVLPPVHQWKHPCDFTFSYTMVCTLGLAFVHWVKALIDVLFKLLTGCFETQFLPFLGCSCEGGKFYCCCEQENYI
jgi:hypothetical protein